MKLACLALLLGAASLKAETFSQADLQHWLAVWQQKQRLQDWNIEIRTARQSELGQKVGHVHFQAGVKRAWITVLDAAECTYVPAERVRKYSELTVVHELVHVSLWPLVRSAEGEGGAVEDVVEDVAQALVFGKLPPCATPRDFMEAEIASLPWKAVDRATAEHVIGRLTTAFLDGRPGWMREHTAACASTIKSFFARSEWR